MRSAALSLIFAASALCQPVISGVAISDTGSTFCRVVGNVSPDAYVQLYYGTTFGTYPYSTWMYLTGVNSIVSDTGVFALNIAALQPGTTYYGYVIAYPNGGSPPTTTTGSSTSNFSCTTSAATLPEYPTKATAYRPAEPVTTGYSTITLNSSAQVATTVTHAAATRCPSDPGWTITAGTPYQTVLNNLTAGNYGMEIVVPQGVTVPVPNNNTYNGGFLYPALAVDPCASGINDPSHGWIWVHTNQINSSDFPAWPSGNSMPFRTGPSWNNNGGFKATLNQSTNYVAGSIFSFYLPGSTTVPVHHFWFSNLDLTAEVFPSNVSTSTVNPTSSGTYTWAVPSGQNYPTGLLVFVTTAPSTITGTVTSYTCSSSTCSLVFNATSFFAGVSGAIATWNIVSTSNSWSSTSLTPSIGSKSIVVPQGLTFNPGDPITLTDFTLYTQLQASVSSYSGTSLALNAIFCGGCGSSYSNWVITPQPYASYVGLGHGEGSAFDQAHPPSYLVFDRNRFITPASTSPTTVSGGIYGSVGANVWVTGNYMTGFQKIGQGEPYLGVGIVAVDCSTGPYTIDNNEVSAAGQNIYFESVGLPNCPTGSPAEMLQNVTVFRNAIYDPPTWLQGYRGGYGAWDGVQRGLFRNALECKNCQYGSFTGNWIDGQFSGQNSGSAFLAFAISSYSKVGGSTGLHDLDFSYNYITHAANISNAFNAGINTCCGFGPESATLHNVTEHDNLAWNIGRAFYSIGPQNSGGLETGYFDSYGVQSHQIFNNSFDINNGDNGISSFPQWIPYLVSAATGGANQNGFRYSFNLDFFSEGASGIAQSGILGSNVTCPACGTFNTVPLPTFTNFTTLFNTAMSQTASSVTATGAWRTSTHICGTSANSGAEPWPDLTQSGCTTLVANMPNLSSDSYPNPGAGTMASRIAAAGLLSYSSGNFNLTPNAANFGGAVGANIQAVEAALGITKNVSVNVAPTSLQVSYTAPDTNACSLDVWTGAGTPARFAASSGSRVQSIVATSLTAGTAYNWRLMCAYAQTNGVTPDRPWFSFPSELSNMQTEGTVSTTASGTSTASVQFSFPSTATSVVMTLTPLTGSPVVQTCSASPCVFSSITRGDYFASNVYKNSGGTQVSAGPAGVVSVR